MTEKKSGRTKLPERIRKGDVIQVPVPKKMREDLEKIADKANKILVDYIREYLFIPLLKDKEKEEEEFFNDEISIKF